MQFNATGRRILGAANQTFVVLIKEEKLSFSIILWAIVIWQGTMKGVGYVSKNVGGVQPVACSSSIKKLRSHYKISAPNLPIANNFFGAQRLQSPKDQWPIGMCELFKDAIQELAYCRRRVVYGVTKWVTNQPTKNLDCLDRVFPVSCLATWLPVIGQKLV